MFTILKHALLGLIISLASVAPFQTHEGSAQSIVIEDNTKILSFNILGFPKQQTDREKRPHFLDPVQDADSRISKIFNAIRREQPDILLLQEVHDEGNQIDETIINGLNDQFSTFYTHTLRGQKVLGSGLLVATRYKNTSFEMHPFTIDGGADRKYVYKGFGILSIRDDNDKLIMRIANTHLQSGKATKEQEVSREGATLTSAQIRDLQAREIIAKLEELNATEPAEINAFGGDLNVDRTNPDDTFVNGEMSILHPDNPALQDGFYRAGDKSPRQLCPSDYTQQDIGEDPEAVDNIVSLPGSHKMVTEKVSEFANYNDISDHAMIKTTFYRTSPN